MKNRKKVSLKNYSLKHHFITIILFLGFTLIYYLTSGGHTPYDYFVRLSDAFLNGRYYLSENPPWLNELITASANKYYVVYPPMPAILAAPFRYILGNRFPQELLAHLVGAITAVLTYRLSVLIKKSTKIAIWASLLSGLGTIIWFLAANGSSWYLGQLVGAMFVMSALVETNFRKRAFLIGVFIGAAFLSRVHLVLALPFFALLLIKRDWKKNLLQLALGFLPFALFNFGYNFIRFGTIFDKAYILIPGVLSEPWYTMGLFHPTYIPRHLKVMFTALPIFSNSFPFIKPSWGGLAIWITTPAFIYAFFSKIKEASVKLSWITIFLISLVVFSHGTTGFAQFGYRFAVDFYPFLIFLTIKGVSRSELKWHHWVLLALSVIVNTWGVLWINKFGWISY